MSETKKRFALSNIELDAMNTALKQWHKEHPVYRMAKALERAMNAADLRDIDADERKAFDEVLAVANAYTVENLIKPENKARIAGAIKLVREVLADAFPEPKPEPKKTPGQVLYETSDIAKRSPWSTLDPSERAYQEKRAQAVLDHANAERVQAEQETTAKVLKEMERLGKYKPPEPKPFDLLDWIPKTPGVPFSVNRCQCPACSLKGLSPFG